MTLPEIKAARDGISYVTIISSRAGDPSVLAARRAPFIKHQVSKLCSLGSEVRQISHNVSYSYGGLN